jgi:hypothetical protein
MFKGLHLHLMVCRQSFGRCRSAIRDVASRGLDSEGNSALLATAYYTETETRACV